MFIHDSYTAHVLLAVILTLLCLCCPYFVNYVRTNDLLAEAIVNFIIGKTGATVRRNVFIESVVYLGVFIESVVFLGVFKE